MIPGPWELILILIVVVVLFGGKKIPEIMGDVGKGINTFKKAMGSNEPTRPPTAQSDSASNGTIEPK
ncbi:MAG: twin-arginine translocase TatA/TatE family subunit [Desulfomonilaceae bacterium]